MASGKLNIARLSLQFDVLALENHRTQMKSKKNQPLQICKWNSYFMLLRILGTNSY
jgi:alpha-galactosidase